MNSMKRFAAICSALSLSGLVATSAAAAPATLYQALRSAPFEALPAGASSFRITPANLGPEQTGAGMVGAMQINFNGGDPKAELRYYVFSDYGSAVAYNNRHFALPPRTGKLLPYPPLAQCAEIQGGGYCNMIIQDGAIVISAVGSSVDGTAAPLMAIGFRHLSAINASVEQGRGNSAVAGTASGACALLSQADVESGLGGPVGMPRLNQVGDCYWDSLRVRGDSIAVQPRNGGRATFDNDRRRIRNAMPLAGVGDDAYAFVSLAGFVQVGILKGGRYVILLVQHQGGPSIPTAQSLARNLAARL